MSSRQRVRSDGQETMALVKKHALAELEEHGAVNFTLDRVLENSGVSRSSVYHHFGNRDGLIAVVSLEQSLRRIVIELQEVEKLADAASTPSEMFDVLSLGITAGSTARAKVRRLRRVSGFAATDSNRSIQESMKEVQLEGTAHFVKILEKAAARGLISPSVPIRGIAYFIQSILVGRVVTDITQSKQIDDDWMEASLTALRALLGTDTFESSR